MTTIELPYPPSVNAYYKNVRGRVVIASAGKRYRERVRAMIRSCGQLPGRVTAIAEFYPPDRRRRDQDNLFKAFFDSIKYGLIEDDSEVKVTLAVMGDPVPPSGLVYLRLLPHDVNHFRKAVQAICS